MIEEFESVMQEPPGGENYGRMASSNPNDEGRMLPLDVLSMQERDMLQQGGFSIIEADRGSGRTGDTYGGGDMGMTAHRGVLHEDEYVDEEILRLMVEKRLGLTYAEIAAVYKAGKPTIEQRQQRIRVDATMLALSRSGANLQAVALALGLSEKTIDRALARAREAFPEQQIKMGVVPTGRLCFICEDKTARPRKRSHRGCPSALMPLPQYRNTTIDLCERCYAGGQR